MKKRLLLLSTILFLLFSPVGALAAQIENAAQNPVIWADVPDPSVIRVGDTYYMSSTTMHMNPGVPIMKSKDLVNWEIVNYVYDVLGANDNTTLSNGQNDYGRGSWASNLRYYDGTFYVVFSSQTMGKTYVFQTTDIENGPWEKSSFDFTHDMSLLFDDGRVFLVHGGGDIRLVELTEDAKAIKEGGLNQIIIHNASEVAGPNVGLPAEGAHIHKIDGKYYIFLITWPAGGMRTQLCFRADELTGPYEGRVVLEDAGIAQGGLVDTPDGDWYAFLFGDRGAVGRIPYLIPVVWEDGWPVLGVDGKVPTELAISRDASFSIVKSDEFQQSTERVGAYHTKVGERVTFTKPAPQEGLGKELLINGGFESGLAGWYADHSAQIAFTDEVQYSGKGSVLVTGRTVTESGVRQALAEKLVPNRRYKVSARVRYDAETAPARRVFSIYLADGGESEGVSIATNTIVKGRWGLIEGTYTASSTAPMNEPQIMIAPSWSLAFDPDKDLMDFYVDEVSFIDTSVPELIVNGSFENGLEQWSAHDTASLAVTDETSTHGANSLYVSGRTATGAGAQQYLTGKMRPGRVYQVFAKVKYDAPSAPETRDFNICFQDGDWQTIEIMGSGTITKGEWGVVEGTYTIPHELELDQPRIFIETSWTSEQDPERDLMDFYVDEVSVLDVTPVEQIVSGENDYNGSNLSLEWQWNHNPDNRHWSLLARPGYLRLTTGSLSTSLLDARNTLTQRTFGPQSAATIAIDVSNMKPGDYAGLALLQENYGFVGIKMDGAAKSIVMVKGNSDGKSEIESVSLAQNVVYLKAEADFRSQRDQAYFYYSLDGFNWEAIGSPLRMYYTLPHFMGYRFGLFNFATLDIGGYVDFDYFRVSDKLTGANKPDAILQASLADVANVAGSPDSEFVIPVTMEALPEGSYNSISASFTIPEPLTVSGVDFNEAGIVGDGSYTFRNGQLELKVSGSSVNFNDPSGLFAEIKLKVDRFVPVERTVTVTTNHITVDGGNVMYDVTNGKANVGLKAVSVSTSVKTPGYGNPLRDYKLGADPYAVVFEGRVYIYLSSDEYMYDGEGNLIDNNFSQLNRVFVMSSADMVNWTDHGAIPVAGIHDANDGKGIAKWAGGSWAPAAAHKKIDGEDKFFLYFSNSAGGIGVLTADTPIGPWSDPLGHALITHDTPGVRGVVWLFDPAVLVDDDGTGYLYFGGGLPGGQSPTPEQVANPQTARVIQLGDDMISTVGEAVTIEAPYMFEDAGIHKYRDRYYYSYCTNFGPRPQGEDVPPAGEIAYMISDNPMGPFEYVTTVLKNPYHFFGVGGNNHHAFFEFEDQWYIVYHAQTVAKAAFGDGKGYRSPHINKVEFYDNGLIKDIQADREGIAQLRNLDPYQRTEAETIAWQKGITTEVCSAPGGYVESLNLNVTDIDDGDWIAVANADFGEEGPTAFLANVASSVGGEIEIRLDSPTGEVIGTLEVAPTGGDQVWKILECDVKRVTGVHNIFFMFKGEGKTNLFNFDYWQFK